jgi:hypothetical protein
MQRYRARVREEETRLVTGDRPAGQPGRPLRVPEGDRAVAPGGVESQSQAGGADLEGGGDEGAPAAEAPEAPVALRRVLRPSPAPGEELGVVLPLPGIGS